MSFYSEQQAHAKARTGYTFKLGMMVDVDCGIALRDWQSGYKFCGFDEFGSLIVRNVETNALRRFHPTDVRPSKAK